jgi:hypothetical protein
MKKFKFLFILFLMVGCKSKLEKSLVGKWYAISLNECGDLKPIQTNIVNLELKSNGNYIFNSTLNVHEEGVYKVEKNLLLFKDMLNVSPTPKILRQDVGVDTTLLKTEANSPKPIKPLPENRNWLRVRIKSIGLDSLVLDCYKVIYSSGIKPN